MLRTLDLFSGIGGFSLGLERTGGFKTVAFCEIEAFSRKVLAKHWPKVPCYHDVRELTAPRLAADGIAVDVICGGFPCQDVSLAGKGAGLAGERSGLWSEFARLIGELRPRYAIVENVAALLSRGLADVLGELAALGYDAEWHCIPACAVGAPHRRDRIWIVAYATRSRRGRIEPWRGPLWRDTDTARDGESGNAHDVPHAISGELRHEPRRWDGTCWAGEAVIADDGKKGPVADAAFVRCDGRPPKGRQQERPGTGAEGGGEYVADAQGQSERTGLCSDATTKQRRGRPSDGCSADDMADARERRLPPSKHAILCGARWRDERRAITERGWWRAEPDVGRVAHGVPSRVDRLRGLGNAVVPQIPELIGRAILAAQGVAL